MSDTNAPAATPAPSLMTGLRGELMRHLPFSRMAPEHVDRFIAASRQAYYAPEEVVLEPASGVADVLHLIRSGSVTGRRGMAEMSGHFEYTSGDLFPVGAALGRRAVTATYTANEDTFCLLLPVQAMHELAAASGPFADFLNRRVLQFLEMSRRAVQVAWSSQTLAEQSLEARLGSLPRKTPLACSADTELGHALGQMHERRVGSVLVVDAAGVPQGIVTRHDILGRVTLPQRPLTDPVGSVMSAPLRCLTVDDTLQDAALLMSRHGIRHVPVTEDGALVNIVSERDLFALQRLSLKQVSTQIRAARDVDTLKLVAARSAALRATCWARACRRVSSPS
jgi:CBS domain-containing protein